MDRWLQNNLACPIDRSPVTLDRNSLSCERQHQFPIVDGIPVMLREDVEATHPYIRSTLKKVSEWKESGTITEDHPRGDRFVDGFVQHEVLFTSGFLYRPVQYRLENYPIPEIRFPSCDGNRLLDIGCNWGRWSIAAATAGYRPVGIDPGIDAVLAARRVCRQLDIEATFVVDDARFLPFRNDAFDNAFSHSVLSSFSKENVRLALDELSRVLKPSGKSLIQMPNKYGVRQYQQQRRRGFTEGVDFETRYWTPSELRTTFTKRLGPTELTADCFFGLGIQEADAAMLPLWCKTVIYSSRFLRKVSERFKPLTMFADSVYLESSNVK